ncbi:replicase [Cucumber necrosis virus]|nr:replicase [Cucumber necrosis virus]AAA42903.1 ORF p33 [Cucumber necrosis virus]QYA72567.1 RNA polymerase pre-readthrough protein [Cucumber necrosis virus]UZP17162.1 replicase [Cucumber necrosis virus]
MDTIKRMLWPKKEIFVGTFATGVERDTSVDIFQLVCRVVLRYMRTGKIENNTDSLGNFIVELLKTDCAAKWEWFMKRRRVGDYAKSLAIASIPVIPLLSYATMKKTVALRAFGNELSFNIRVPRPSVPKKGLLLRLAAGLALAPICALAMYATLPREKLSVFKLRTEARAHMEDEREATDCLVVEPARELKGKDGEDLLTGSRMTKVIASTGRPRRRPYAAKIAQVARAKVGYLKNTPENRLIYQRVMIEIMDKDCVRYVDRDVILPLAIGCCFVYPDGVEESAALWGSDESLGVK